MLAACRLTAHLEGYHVISRVSVDSGVIERFKLLNWRRIT